MREKETLLVTSNVSFSLNVFLFIVSIKFLPFYDHQILLTANFFLNIERVKNFRLTMVNRSYNKGPDKAYELLQGFEPSAFEQTRF